MALPKSSIYLSFSKYLLRTNQATGRVLDTSQIASMLRVKNAGTKLRGHCISKLLQKLGNSPTSIKQALPMGAKKVTKVRDHGPE